MSRGPAGPAAWVISALALEVAGWCYEGAVAEARVCRSSRRPRFLGPSARAVNQPHAEFTARLTIDVAPALRGRIEIAAFERGVTVADMLRALLDREFPANGGAAS